MGYLEVPAESRVCDQGAGLNGRHVHVLVGQVDLQTDGTCRLWRVRLRLGLGLGVRVGLGSESVVDLVLSPDRLLLLLGGL